MPGETQFKDQIKKFLNQQNCWTLKYWGGGIYTRRGIPDLFICCNGRFIATEVKAEDGEPTSLQLITLKRISESGGISVLLYPADFERFKDLIKSIWMSHEDEICRHKIYFMAQINRELNRRTK